MVGMSTPIRSERAIERLFALVEPRLDSVSQAKRDRHDVAALNGKAAAVLVEEEGEWLAMVVFDSELGTEVLAAVRAADIGMHVVGGEPVYVEGSP
jgi:hypothetical protein